MTNRYHCDDKERLVAFLYGETSDRERAEVEAHLAGCAPAPRKSTSCARSAWIWPRGSRRRPNSGFASSASP